MAGTPFTKEFLDGVARIFRDEGIDSNVRGSHGGHTWYGISRAGYPGAPDP